MTEQTRNAWNQYPLVAEYVGSIPEDLHDLLLPDFDQLGEFATAVKALRIRETEREYVRELQDYYRVPLRPNESVKRTMIRVRLAILKLRIASREDGDLLEAYGPLPVDPLE